MVYILVRVSFCIIQGMTQWSATMVNASVRMTVTRISTGLLTVLCPDAQGGGTIDALPQTSTVTIAHGTPGVSGGTDIRHLARCAKPP